ncbi:MAG: aldehyde ferredoxin oxidoreductase family protein [bacterium]
MAGYWNKVLEVDLSRGEIKELPVSDDVYRLYLGGSGVGAYFMAQRIGGGTDPLDPYNPLMFMLGPLTGSQLPGCATRFDVQARSPLTGIWGEASCGGSFGVQLKRAGYDGLIVTGEAESPVYIRIADGDASIEDASDLWGKDVYETDDLLRERIKGETGKTPSVLAIGQAGENLVRFAAILNDKGNAAGRTGLGAVMGSKKLKAITAFGTKKIEFADPENLKELNKAVRDKLKENIPVQSLSAFGTNGAVDLAAMTGDLPIKNYSVGAWDDAEKINGPTMTDTILTSGHSCFGCPVGCKRRVKVEGGEYAIPEGPGPEYETVASYGTMLMINDLKPIAKINELCNRYGMDTITSGCTIAFIMDCVEKGILSAADMDGIELKWGAAGAVIRMVEKMAKREGFGDVAAGGSRAIAEKIGGNAGDFLTTIKGLEAPMHDPRGFHGQALAYATSNRGACHVNAMAQFVEQGYIFYHELGLGDALPGQQSEGKARVVKISQDIGQIFNCASICHFPAIAFSERDILNMLNYATGFGYTLESMMEVGERVWILKRYINNMFGVTRADDIFPKQLLKPVEDGPAAGSVPDIELMIRDFYEIRSLDEQGRPSREKLEALGLGDLLSRVH